MKRMRPHRPPVRRFTTVEAQLHRGGWALRRGRRPSTKSGYRAHSAKGVVVDARTLNRLIAAVRRATRTLPEVDFAGLPEELQTCATWNLHQGRMYCFIRKGRWSSYDEAKDSWKGHDVALGLSRGAAWSAVPKHPQPGDEHNWPVRNPWRRMHSQQYWCWSRRPETA